MLARTASLVIRTSAAMRAITFLTLSILSLTLVSCEIIGATGAAVGTAIGATAQTAFGAANSAASGISRR